MDPIIREEDLEGGEPDLVFRSVLEVMDHPLAQKPGRSPQLDFRVMDHPLVQRPEGSPQLDFRVPYSQDQENSVPPPERGDYGETTNFTSISIQTTDRDPAETRQPLPITRIDNRLSYLIPLSGLQLLYDIHQVYIRQTYELSSLLSGEDSENRYLIKSNDGNTLFACIETSSNWTKSFCGSSRSFLMKFFDQTQQVALILERRFASSCSSLGCCLQRIDVYEPPYQHIGSAQQEWSVFSQKFTIRDSNNSILYRVHNNNTCPSWSSPTDMTFYIRDSYGNDLDSHISHIWDPELSAYDLSVRFPNSEGSTKNKALIITCAILLEYMFFLKLKSRRCLECIR